MDGRLIDYPYVVVRLACRYCHRSGQYRLANLAERFGAQRDLRAVLIELAGSCKRWRWPKHGQRAPWGCGAYLPDLETPRRPPDEPAGARLRVVEGGRR
jgi:hypothetical protein